MKFCLHCGEQLPDKVSFCPYCGKQFGSKTETVSPKKDDSPLTDLFDRLTDSVSKMTGGDTVVRPPFKKIFSQIFKKHSRKESEEIFIYGTDKTTPALSGDSSLWPQPWLFSRVFLAFAAAFVMLWVCAGFFQNINAFPGLMVVGAFAVPISTFVFFFELNTPRNISFFTSIKIFLVGGCMSLMFTLLLFSFFPIAQLDYFGAIVVGVVEEVGKLAIVAYFIKREKSAKYNINGLLIGALVGAGFAAFESAGYAFAQLLDGGYNAMIGNIFIRGVLAPGGHVVWAAMSGYALMLVKGDKPLNLSFLGKGAFWKVFWMPIAMHAVWDMPIPIGAEFALVQFILCLLSWVVIFVLIDNSLDQLAAVVNKAYSQNDNVTL